MTASHSFHYTIHRHITIQGRDSSVGISTRYRLDGPEIESRWVGRFSAPVQTGPGAHPASYIISNELFPGVKRPGRGVDHPPPSSAEVKKRVELHPFLAFMACSRVNLPYNHSALNSLATDNVVK
jgi:hypothetical protein